MSKNCIEKYEIDSFKKESIPFNFTVLPNIVLQNFTHEALGLWVHLQSLPPTFKPKRKYLMNKFGIGRDKVDRLLKHLNDNFLIGYEYIRYADGKNKGAIEKVRLIVKNGNEYYKNIVLKQGDSTTTLKTSGEATEEKLSTENENLSTEEVTTPLKTHAVANPLSGETAPIKEIYINNKSNTKKRAREFSKDHTSPSNVENQSTSYKPQKKSERAPLSKREQQACEQARIDTLKAAGVIKNRQIC